MELQPPENIPNRALTVADLPTFDVTQLDPQNFNGGHASGRSDREWAELWTFALTFQGADYFGGDSGALGRLVQFSDSVKEALDQDGRLPKIDLRLLRACLYVEQRRWCKWGDVMTERCPPDVAAYLQALLSGIRAEIT